MKFTPKSKSTISMGNERLQTKIRGTTARETRFDSHTHSSLMKIKEPIGRSSSMKSARGKLQVGIIPSRLNGVCKTRSNVAKQTNNMQALRTILKRNRTSGHFLQNELTQAICQEAKLHANSSAIPFPCDNLLKNVSCNLGTNVSIESSALLIQDDKLTTTAGQKYPENSHMSIRDDTSTDVSRNFQQQYSTTSLVSSLPRTESMTNIYNNSEDQVTAENSRELQLQSKDEKSMCEVEALNDISKLVESEEKHEKKILENYSMNIQICPQTVQTNSKVATIQDADLDRNAKFMRHIDGTRNKDIESNCDVTSNKTKCAIQKNLVSAKQRAWRPAGINKTSESTLSLIPKIPSSGRYIASTKSRQQSTYSSVRRMESFDSEGTSATSINRVKRVMMKDNRNPHVHSVKKIYSKCLVEAKQQEKSQSGSILPKRRRSMTKIGSYPSSRLLQMNSKISNKDDDVNSVSPRSGSNLRSRHRQMPSAVSKKYLKSSTDHCRIEPTLVYKKKSRPSEVIHALREFINSSKEDDEMEEDTEVDKMSDHETNDREILSTNYIRISSISSDNKLHFTKTDNLDVIDQSTLLHKSISMQTDLIFPSFLKEISSEEDFNSKGIAKLTQTIGTQTSPSKKVEIGCNTMSCDILCENTGDLINLTNPQTDINSPTIKTKLTSDHLHMTESSSLKYSGTDDEDERIDYISKTAETRSRTINANFDFIMEEKNVVYKEEKARRDKSYLTSSKNCDNLVTTDKQESIMHNCFNNYDTAHAVVNNSSLKKSYRSLLSIYDYDASCSDSSEEVECIKNDARHKDITTSELKLNIPSDVIAAFHLATERAQNIHKAIILYNKSLMSKKSEEQDEGTDENCIGNSTSLVSYKNENMIIPKERDANCRFIVIKHENFENFSTHSSSSNSSIRIGKLAEETNGTLALLAIEEAYILSREHFVIFICCILCTVVYWCLEFSFTCNYTA